MEGDLRRLLRDTQGSLVFGREALPRPMVSFAPAPRRGGGRELRLIQQQVLARTATEAEAEAERRAPAGSLSLVAERPLPVAAPEIAVISDHPLKRCLDVTVATALLFLLVPLLFFVGLFVALDGHGPVLFLQRRCGLNGAVFRICKFRTMKVCDDGDAVAQTRRADGRITRFGAFLRRTSIDELPQLINVLVGDMSLVGPRPHAAAHDRAFLRALPAYAERYRVRPGITGLAQVRGERGAIRNRDQLARRVAFDLEYIARWSIWADLRILFASVAVVVRPTGA